MTSAQLLQEEVDVRVRVCVSVCLEGWVGRRYGTYGKRQRTATVTSFWWQSCAPVIAAGLAPEVAIAGCWIQKAGGTHCAQPPA